MLTKTQTIETSLSPAEKIALDDQQVFTEYTVARQAGNKPVAIEYAKVMMLKAMAMDL